MLIYFKKYFIVIKETKNEKTIAIRFINVKRVSSKVNIFVNPYTETEPKIGIDNKKDIFAASILLKLNNLAAVIAIPDLRTPGIKIKFVKTNNDCSFKIKIIFNIFF